MKRKALYFVLTLLVMAVFSLVGCGGGGGHSNPASSNVAGNARVSGVVYDSSNKPVANAQVRMVLVSKAVVNSLLGGTNTSNRLSTNGNQTEFNTLTDNKGQYSFVNVPYGEYTLSALTADQAQVVTNLVVKGEEVNVDNFILKPFGSISGKVTNNGQGVGGAIVCLEGTSYCAITETDGSYILRNVPVDEDFNLIAMASGYDTTSGQEVKIIASGGLDKTGMDLTLTASSQKAYSVKCNIKGDGKDLTGLLVFAYSADGNNTYVGRVGEDTTCTIKITASGTYNFLPAYIINGSNQTGTATGTVNVTDKQIQKSEQLTMDLTMGAVSTSTTEYASLKVELDQNISGDFTASIYDSTGHENKKTLKSNSPATFENLPGGIYALAVYSDTMLKVETGIEITSGEITTKTIKPVTVVGNSDSVGIISNTGIATLYLDYSSDSPATDADKDDLYFSLGAKSSDGIKTLYDENIETTAIKVSKTNITQKFSIDNLQPDDEINFVRITFKNGLNKNVFEKDFAITEADEIGSDSFKRVSLMKSENAALTQSDNVILFKALTDQNAVVYYLVVTDKTAYVFNPDGTQNTALAFSSKFTDFGSDFKIKYGNAAFLEDSTNPALAVQYTVPISGGDGNGELYIYKYSFNKLVTAGTPDKILPIGDDANRTHYNAYSPNKLLLTSNGGCISVCDNFILNYNGSEWKQTYFGEALESTSTPSDYQLKSLVIASYTTIIPEPNNSFKICYLNHDPVCAAYKSYLVVNNLDSSFNQTATNYNYEIGDYTLTNFTDGNCDTVINTDGNHKYYGFYILTASGYPFSIADCLDNAEATNKAFVYDGYSWTSPTINTDPKYVFSDTLYSGTNIESSYRTAGNFEAWIDRNSKGHFLNLRNMNNYKEKKIEIKQVLNSSSFLEASIGYTSLTNGNKIHVLTTDNEANLQVLVLNCIESNN